MATSKRALQDNTRKKYMEKVKAFLESEGEDVLQIESNTICFPTLLEDGTETWVRIPFQIPSTEHAKNGGAEFDGYERAEDYRMKREEKAAKAAERARQAEEKKKKDAAARAAKEMAKAAKAAK